MNNSSRRTNLANLLLVKQLSLSDTATSGNPCTAKDTCSFSTVTYVVAVCTTYASLHLEYASTTTRNIFPIKGLA